MRVQCSRSLCILSEETIVKSHSGHQVIGVCPYELEAMFVLAFTVDAVLTPWASWYVSEVVLSDLGHRWHTGVSKSTWTFSLLLSVVLDGIVGSSVAIS